jgi:hypothetical protein
MLQAAMYRCPQLSGIEEERKHVHEKKDAAAKTL